MKTLFVGIGWAEGTMGGNNFVQGIQFLIKMELCGFKLNERLIMIETI